jgi:hypothetical protein
MALSCDMRARGWFSVDLAREAGVHVSTVTRFFNGDSRTPKTLAKLALALGKKTERYLVEV